MEDEFSEEKDDSQNPSHLCLARSPTTCSASVNELLPMSADVRLKPSPNEKCHIRQMIHQHPSNIIHTTSREDKVYPGFKINFCHHFPMTRKGNNLLDIPVSSSHETVFYKPHFVQYLKNELYSSSHRPRSKNYFYILTAIKCFILSQYPSHFAFTKYSAERNPDSLGIKLLACN